MQTIGRKDRVRFPLIYKGAIKVKIDSGAYTSSMHCSKTTIDKEGNLRAWIGRVGEEVECIFADFKTKIITSSVGVSKERYLVVLLTQIFDNEYETLFSLNNRKSMRYPVLIGRRLLNNNFTIDTKKVNVSYRQNRKKVG